MSCEVETLEPRLTVVLICSADTRPIAAALEHLECQTIADQLDLLILAPEPSRLQIPGETVNRFANVRVLEGGHDRLVGATRAAGIRLANTEFVAMTEDHAFSNADWAECLLKRLLDGADLVGPRMETDDLSPLAWANQILAYGPWMTNTVTDINMMPGHHSAYRRTSALAAGGADLDKLMSAEVLLHWQMHRSGKRIVYAPESRTSHANLVFRRESNLAFYNHARNFAALRCQIDRLARAKTVVLFPLIFALRFKRALADVYQLLPAEVKKTAVLRELCQVLFSSVCGEVVGAAFGAGDSPRADWMVELDRGRFVSDPRTNVSPRMANYCQPSVSLLRENRRIRVGLVGCGQLAREVHLPLLSNHRDFEVLAICDPSEDSLQAAARIVRGARTFRSSSEMLTIDELDAAFICSPTSYHAEQCVEVFESGKHVYLEKPIADNLADGNRVLDAWYTSSRIGMIGFNYRRHPQLSALASAMWRLGSGEPLLLRTVFSCASKPMSAWRTLPQGGSGVLLDFASHDADLVRYLVRDEIDSVRASVSPSGMTATIEAATCRGVRWQGFYSFETVDDARLELTTSEGEWGVDRYGQLRVKRRGRTAVGPMSRWLGSFSPANFAAWWQKRGQPWGDPSFIRSLTAFADAIRGTGNTDPDLLDGWKSLAVIEAATRSAEEGSWQKVAKRPKWSPYKDLPISMESSLEQQT